MALPDGPEIQAFIQPIMERFGVPGLGLALAQGDQSNALGLGVCDTRQNTPVDADTTFQLASCSKAYTATAAALLVDAAAMSWDDPVQKHIPEFRMHDERLSSLATVRDLLSMRLGYSNQGLLNWGRNLETGLSVILERLRHLEVAAGFREQFTYLNPAYTLAAEIIARVSGDPFALFVQNNLCAPLGLSRTFIREGWLDPREQHALPHVRFPDSAATPLARPYCGGKLGESCVYSSPNDAARWLRLHLNKGEAGDRRLVSQTAMNEMHRPHVYGSAVPALGNHFLAYAMGWQCRDTPYGPILLHEGVEFGVSTFTILDLSRKTGAAVYANINSSPAVKAIGYSLIDLLAGRTPQSWADTFAKLAADDQQSVQEATERQLSSNPQPAFPIDAITGSYYSPANGMIDISYASGKLHVCVRDGWVFDAVLESASENLYTGPYQFEGMRALARSGMRIRFFQDQQGMAILTPGFGTARKVA